MSTTLMSYSEVERFARDLVFVGELDPMYDLIYQGRKRYGAQWSAQFVMHFFMYYDAGQAAALARAHTELDFWPMQNYGYEGFRRGTERRHFRGDKGRQALRNFQAMGSPQDIWDLPPLSYSKLVDYVGNAWGGTQTGPYFTWKAMDLLERCLGVQIELSLADAAFYLPDEPRKAAKMLWPNYPLTAVLERVRGMVSDLTAPGQPSRRCGYAEAETILCALKGYLKGSYKFGSDIDRRHEQLKDYPDLLALLPAKQDWSKYVYSLDPQSVSA